MRETATPTKRLPKAERREQLLETALSIVRDEGTDALTLGYLAERAGVSKPIAYEHFKTRGGLLSALYELLSNQHVAALLELLGRTRKRLRDVAKVIGRAYVECYMSIGPEWYALSAAMKGDDEQEAFQRQLMDDYVDLYCDTLAPYSNLSRKDLHLRCVGIIGAGEGISQAMLRGKVTEDEAAEAIASLIVEWLSAKG